MPLDSDHSALAVPARAQHPAGPKYLERIDRELLIREKHREIFRRLSEPLFAWPFAAALTQFILG